MSDWSGPVLVDHVVIITARALCGSPTFEVRGTACRFMVRDQDGAQDDCAVIERDDLRTLIPAMRPTAIDFRAEPDEAEDMAALCAELRQRIGGKLRLVAARKDAPRAPTAARIVSGSRRASSITCTTRKH